MSVGLPGLKDKVAIVTGSSQGIGAAVVELFRELDVEVFPFDLPEYDLSQLEKIPAYVESVVSKTSGKLHILINNAGITNMGDVVETPLSELEDVLTINFKAPFMLMKSCIPHMKKSGGGAIVNNTSDQALIGKRYSAVYGASKAALAQLTKSAALDWAKDDIRVNCVAPGSTDTPMLHRVLKDLHERYPAVYPADGESFYKDSIPLKRFASPRETAWAMAFLASDAASFITGVTLPVDGGFTAQ